MAPSAEGLFHIRGPGLDQADPKLLVNLICVDSILSGVGTASEHAGAKLFFPLSLLSYLGSAGPLRPLN